MNVRSTADVTPAELAYWRRYITRHTNARGQQWSQLRMFGKRSATPDHGNADTPRTHDLTVLGHSESSDRCLALWAMSGIRPAGPGGAVGYNRPAMTWEPMK